MRPRSIVQFEQLNLLSVAIGVLMAAFAWDETLAVARSAGFGLGFVVAVHAVTLGVVVILTLLISRRASVVSKWILIVLFVGGLVVMARDTETLFRGGALVIARVVQILLQLVAILLLFTPEARLWLRSPSRTSVS